MSKSEGTVKMKIEVTREDINSATRMCMKSCAIATALRRQGVSFFGVLPIKGVLWHGGSASLLPVEAARFAIQFDNHYDIAPFTFELDVPLSAMVTA